jgi:hypothetical protein
MNNCLECGNTLISKDAKKFCNRSCSAKYNNRKRKDSGWKPSEEQKIKTSLTFKKLGIKPASTKGKEFAIREIRQCVECGTDFRIIKTSNKKYCSKECSSKHIGGYRNGSGRSKSGYYNGIYCGSTYELCWVIYNLDHNIKFSRFDGYLERNGIKYYPDFILSDNKTIIETKGYENQKSVDLKTQVAESFGYNVHVLRFNDLKYAFTYVKETYNTEKYYTLYDGYKPLYEYTCSHCGKNFTRDKKLKTINVYCSRTCNGKRVTPGNITGRNQYTKNKTL